MIQQIEPVIEAQVATTVGNKRLLARLSRIIPYLGMFVMVLILWLPFGFKITGLGEEWSINLVLDRKPLFITTANSDVTEMAISVGRPFQLFFFTVAHALDPNSFFYYNVFLML